LTTQYIEDAKKAVERYLEWGLIVIPAVYGQKRPEVEWKEYRKKPPSEKQMKSWFDDGRQHNIAILCGPVSGNLVVQDFDDPEIYPRFYKPDKIEAATPVVQTGRGGIHVYLRSNKPVPSFRIPELKMEVRSAGNIVIAPPSIHPNGQAYRFLNPNVKGIASVADLEESVWCKAQELGVKPPEPLFEEESAEHPGQPYTGEDPPCIAKLMEGVEEGQRNEAAIRLASFHLKFKHVTDQEKVLNLLERWNRRNRPPLPSRELMEVVRNAAALERGYGCRHLRPWCNEQACPLKRRASLRRDAEQEAERILSQPDVIAALEPHLDNVIAGEKENKALVFTLLAGGRSPDPAMKQIMIIKAEHGAGKTTLMKLADAFRTKSVGRFTAHALDYADLEGYEVLRIQEIGMMDQEFQGVSTVKFLSPDDMGYTIEATERDPETGRFTTRQYRIPPITLITSTARVQMDPAFERRAWILNPDESEEQTRRIREWKSRHEREKGFVALGLMRETSYEHSMAVLRAVARKLEPCEVVLPFPETVSKILRSERLRVRGDYDKIFAEVKLYGFLHQKTLPRAKGRNGRNVVIVTPESAWKALRLAAKPYATMTSGLEERSRRLISALKDLEVTEEGDTVDVAQREKLSVKMNRSVRTVREYLDDWVDAGYMSKTGGGKSGTPVLYKLLYDLSVIEEKSGGMVEIIDPSIEFFSNAEKEAELWLEDTLEKMTFTDGWSRERILQAFNAPLSKEPHITQECVEEQPSAEPVFSRPPFDLALGSVQPNEPNSAEGSLISKPPGSETGEKPETARFESCWVTLAPGDLIFSHGEMQPERPQGRMRGNGEKPVSSPETAGKPDKLGFWLKPASPSASAEKSAAQPDWVWRRIKPGGKCEFCSRRPAEYEITGPKAGAVFRLCEVCFRTVWSLEPAWRGVLAKLRDERGELTKDEWKNRMVSLGLTEENAERLFDRLSGTLLDGVCGGDKVRWRWVRR
jgi:hypothetical protein